MTAFSTLSKERLNHTITIADAIQSGISKLDGANACSDSPKLDSEILLLQVLNQTSEHHLSKTWLLTWPEKRLTITQFEQFNHYLDLRSTGMPIAYITGEKDFWTLSLSVTPDTLIPRPETEMLVESALEKISTTEKTALLDLGTGSGAIALAIASERQYCRITATDISQAALDIAAKNAQKTKSANVTFLQSDWFDGIKQQGLDAKGLKFDFIVCNPPYIAADDPLVEENVRLYEPSGALFSSHNGLDDMHRIIQQLPDYLNPGGWILFEHGYKQSNAVQALLKKYAFTNIDTINDLNQQPRVTLGQFL